MRKLRNEHRPGVAAFDWKQHATREPFAPMWGAASKLSDAKAAAFAKAAEIDRTFMPQARAAAKRQYLESSVAPLIKSALDAMDKADAESARIRSGMTMATVDKSDLAGAILRMDIRARLSALPDEKRNALLAMPDQLDAATSAAILEAPAWASGASETQYSRLAGRVIAGRYQSEAASIATLEDAVETLDFQVGRTIAELSKEMGVSVAEVAGLVPTLGERLSEITGGLPVNDAPPKAA